MSDLRIAAEALLYVLDHDHSQGELAAAQDFVAREIEADAAADPAAEVAPVVAPIVEVASVVEPAPVVEVVPVDPPPASSDESSTPSTSTGEANV